jgi:hypothetical protein
MQPEVEGSAVTVKGNIHHNEEVKIEAEDIHATALNITTKRYNIGVVSLYSPPKHNTKADRYVEIFKNIGNRFIIGDDFNAKHTHWGLRQLLKAENY